MPATTKNTISDITLQNITNTPIVTFLKEKIPKEKIKDWEIEWKGFVNRQQYNHKLSEKLIDFYETVEKYTIQISKKDEYAQAIKIDTLNKYETCIISGIRKLQEDIGMAPNLNHVKFKNIKKTYLELK